MPSDVTNQYDNEFRKIRRCKRVNENAITGNIIDGVIVQNKKYSTSLLMDMIGVEDRFGESGEPWELNQSV